MTTTIFKHWNDKPVRIGGSLTTAGTVSNSSTHTVSANSMYKDGPFRSVELVDGRIEVVQLRYPQFSYTVAGVDTPSGLVKRIYAAKDGQIVLDREIFGVLERTPESYTEVWEGE